MTLFEPEPTPAVPSGAVVRVKLLVAYDGGPFAGFAVQPGRTTVAGVLGAALAQVVDHAVELTCAGRTDAGVHARGQVVSVDVAAASADPVRIQRGVNRLVAPSIVVREAVVCDDPTFDARFSARWRRYRYTVLNSAVPDPFLAPTAWWVARPLDLARLRLACDPLIGEHDFRSFCRRRRGVPEGVSVTYERTVFDARWEPDPVAGPGVLHFWITGSAFCHSMVRSIVGTLVDVGGGRGTPGDIGTVLRAHDRSLAGRVAPAHGLSLWEVGYSDSPVPPGGGNAEVLH